MMSKSLSDYKSVLAYRNEKTQSTLKRRKSAISKLLVGTKVSTEVRFSSSNHRVQSITVHKGDAFCKKTTKKGKQCDVSFDDKCFAYFYTRLLR